MDDLIKSEKNENSSVNKIDEKPNFNLEKKDSYEEENGEIVQKKTTGEKFKKNESSAKNFFLFKLFKKRSRSRLSKSTSMHTTIRETSMESVQSEP